jgi:hypothetical protein
MWRFCIVSLPGALQKQHLLLTIGTRDSATMTRDSIRSKSSTPAHLFLRCEQRSLLRIQLLLLLLEHPRARLRASLQCLILNLEVEQLQATQQTAGFRLQRDSLFFVKRSRELELRTNLPVQNEKRSSCCNTPARILLDAHKRLYHIFE